MNSVNNNAVSNSNSNSNISKKDNRANTLTARLLNKFEQSNIQAKLETVLTSIPLNKLKNNGNSVRPSGEHIDVITKMAEIIQNGEYDPYRYIPPIVEKSTRDDDSYMIISGHHRFKAHSALGITEMECAVVKFNSERDRSLWRQLENTDGFDGFVKNVTSREDNIILVTDLVNRGVISSDRKSIQDYIIDAKIVTEKAEKAINTIVNAVLKNTGKQNTYDYVRTWDSSEKKEVIEVLQSKFPDKKFVSATFKELEDIDYDHRTMLQVVDSFVEDPTRPIVVVYAVNGANKEKIEDIRDHKPKHLVPSFVERWSKVIDLQNKGFDLSKLVTLDPLPQFGSEIKGSNNGIDDYISRFEKKYSNTDEVTEKLMEAMLTAKGNDRKALKDRIKKILSGDRDPQEVVQ
jgi:hypothetical protein